MSRAFVKEPEGGQVRDDTPELPISPHPNFVTATGLCALQERLGALQADAAETKGHTDDGNHKDVLTDSVHLAQIEREIRYLEARLESAQPVDLTKQPRDKVAFGARVSVVDDNDHQLTYQIVGEDEADVEAHKVGYVSPLARALMDREVGDTAKWQRPAGDINLEILSIDYPA